MAAFAVAAFVLAITGIYAVVMYMARQRTREIGIRMALGATRAKIVRLVMGHGLRFICLGLVLGIAGAAGVARLLSSMLFGLSATDPGSFGAVAAVVATASVAACAVPALRTLKSRALLASD